MIRKDSLADITEEDTEYVLDTLGYGTLTNPITGEISELGHRERMVLKVLLGTRDFFDAKRVDFTELGSETTFIKYLTAGAAGASSAAGAVGSGLCVSACITPPVPSNANSDIEKLKCPTAFDFDSESAMAKFDSESAMAKPSSSNVNVSSNMNSMNNTAPEVAIPSISFVPSVPCESVITPSAQSNNCSNLKSLSDKARTLDHNPQNTFININKVIGLSLEQAETSTNSVNVPPQNNNNKSNIYNSYSGTETTETTETYDRDNNYGNGDEEEDDDDDLFVAEEPGMEMMIHTPFTINHRSSNNHANIYNTYNSTDYGPGHGGDSDGHLHLPYDPVAGTIPPPPVERVKRDEKPDSFCTCIRCW